MKPNIPENPRNIRISTYLTAEEVSDVARIVGDQSMAAWLRDLVLHEIRRRTIVEALGPIEPAPIYGAPMAKCSCED